MFSVSFYTDCQRQKAHKKKKKKKKFCIRVNLLPRDLQVEFDGPQVINVHSHHLRHGGEQLLGLADHAAHQHVSGQALQLRHLIRDKDDIYSLSGPEKNK